VEQADDRDAGSEPTVLRAQVYDNAPYYITWYNETWVEVTVDGGSPTTIPAMSSQGQIFRVEIPGNLAGNISYQWFSRDEYGNAGSSVVKTYAAGGSSFSSYCAGDINSSVGCPCFNETGSLGAGCENSTGQGALLTITGNASVSADTVVFSGSNLPTGPGLYFQGNNAINSGNGNPFGDGLRCAGGNVKRLQVRFSSGGSSQTSVSISSAAGNVNAGSVKRYQLWYRDPSAGAPCQSGFNLTNGIEVTWSA
jgi:hypothetical protein